MLALHTVDWWVNIGKRHCKTLVTLVTVTSYLRYSRATIVFCSLFIHFEGWGSFCERLQKGLFTFVNNLTRQLNRGRIQVKTWCMGPYAGVDYNSLYVNSRVDSNIFTMGNPMPESTLEVHKIENFFDSEFGICVISLLFMHK